MNVPCCPRPPLEVACALPLLALVLAAPASATTAAEVGGCAGTVVENVVAASPANYSALLATLQPGDLLRLAAGTYTQGLTLQDRNGEPDRCVIIEGPAAGAPAVFLGRSCCNTVDLIDVSYLVIRNLELDGQGEEVDGVKASSLGTSHHVTLENLVIRGHGAHQQIVGINTKGKAWNWVIRRNRIEGAGTGIYLGDSNGEQEFVAGLIEHNLITDSLGYNLQIKHQNGRDTGLGIPAQATTIIRHNVLSKAANAAGGGDARPNLLVGHWPLAGAGSTDVYQIYGNLLWQNPTGEPLFQGEGNIAFHHNLLVNSQGPAVWIQPHEDVPREIHVFQNTVVVRSDN